MLQLLDSGWVSAGVRAAQDGELDTVHLQPAIRQAQTDGLGTLGQFVYFDALVMHGPGEDADSFGGIRDAALARARPPSEGGDEAAYLTAFLDARVAVMRRESAHSDTSRVDTEQRLFLREGNLALDPPLQWQSYGDTSRIDP